jgi:hypothetical protein
LKFRQKVIAAFIVFAVLIGAVFSIQWAYLSQPANTEVTGYNLDETFSVQDFLYGPQSWVPYASKIPIIPGVNIEGNDNFYIMFVDLNATSNLTATFPCVRVDYSMVGLDGMAAFHIYGYIKSNEGLSWTNRVDGGGANGYYVTSSASSTSSLLNPQPMPDYNHIFVQVSNEQGAKFDDYGNNTYFMKFEKEGGGLNSLHITTDPKDANGNVTTTSNLNGTFYVNFTGDRVQDNFILLVAVNGTIGQDFRLNLKSSAPS